MGKDQKKKKSKGKWILILIVSPIIMIMIAVGIIYGIVQYKLGSGDNNPKKELVNSLIKDSISHPTEIKGVLDSISITDEEPNENSSNEVTPSTPSPDQNADASNETKKSSVEDLKENYADYDLISSSAENVGEDNYHLIAKIKNKITGEIKNVEVTTKLSEGTRNLLKNYKNGN